MPDLNPGSGRPMPPLPLPDLFGATLERAAGVRSQVVPFRFNCTGRVTQINVSVPADFDGPPPTLLIVSHGEGTQTGQESIDMYQQPVELCVRTGLFAVVRPLWLDGQSVTVGQSEWRDRVCELEELVNRAGELGTWADGKYGVLGHSYGTDNAQGIEGIRYSGVSLRDGAWSDPLIVNPLLGAIALWSPEVDAERMTERSWERIAVPMLTVTGTQDFTRQSDPVFGSGWERRIYPHAHAPSIIDRIKFVHQYGHDAAGAVGTPGGGDNDPLTAAVVCDVTLAFFCACLRGDRTARTWLEDGKSRWTSVLAEDGYQYLPAVSLP